LRRPDTDAAVVGLADLPVSPRKARFPRSRLAQILAWEETVSPLPVGVDAATKDHNLAGSNALLPMDSLACRGEKFFKKSWAEEIQLSI